MLPDYMPHDITKKFWKQKHFENMTFSVVAMTSLHQAAKLGHLQNSKSLRIGPQF